MFDFLKRNQHEETRSAGGYTDALVALAAGNASRSTARYQETSAVEFAVGLMSRCFSVATIQPAIPALTPAFMASLVRTLLLTGNALHYIDVDLGGGVTLLPASSWDISGGPMPSSWRYRLDLSGPSRTELKHAPGDGVIHVRTNTAPFTPWRGVSPLESAGVSSELLAQMESSFRDESRAKSGFLLPIPEGLSDATIEGLKVDLAAMRGNVGLVETTASGAGAGRANAPQADWIPRRFGSTFPQYNVELRRDIGSDVCSTLGISSVLFRGGDGGSMREAYRQLLVAGIQPLAAIIMAELSEKLERPFQASFRKLAAADIAARARAYSSLIQAQVDAALALELSGLED